MSNLIENLGKEPLICSEEYARPTTLETNTNYIPKAFIGAIRLLRNINNLVNTFNNLRSRMINEGIEYQVEIRRDYDYVGLSPKIYPQDLIKKEREQTVIKFLGASKELLELCKLPTQIATIKEIVKDYNIKKIYDFENNLNLSNSFDNENYITYIIDGYKESEYLTLSLILIPNINYFKQREILREPALPYNIVMLTSPESLLNIIDNIFTYRIIYEIFKNHCDVPIATALFFTSHIMGNEPLKKFLPRLGYNTQRIKNILRVKHLFQTEYDLSLPLTKNIFNIIASFGMVDWDLYNYISFIADMNYGDEFTEMAMDRLKSYMKQIRSKIKIFIDNIRIESFTMKVRDTITDKGEKYKVSKISNALFKDTLLPINDYDDAGIIFTITEQLNPPVIVNDKFINIKDPLKIISPKPLLCDEPEYDKNGYPLYDILLKDGRLLRNVPEPELSELRYQIVVAEMKCRKREINKNYNVRKITSEYISYNIQNVKRQVKNEIDLSALTKVATEGLSINSRVDFIKCFTEINISSEVQANIIIYSDMIERSD